MSHVPILPLKKLLKSKPFFKKRKNVVKSGTLRILEETGSMDSLMMSQSNIYRFFIW
jgi:hypothetical protein